MAPQHQHEYRERDLEVAAQLAANSIQIQSLQEEVTEGFAKLSQKLDDLIPRITKVETKTDHLEAAGKDRRGWIGNVVTGVIVGVVVLIATALAGN